ncbi:MAG: hypothetical protein IH999_09660 [Proteobacteria bacterium]|nr:hypothetical protein [Pseudomonadota bacterium]
MILLAFDRLPARLFRWRLARAAAALAADARRVFLSASDAAVIFIPAALIHATVPLIVFLIAASLNIEVSLLQCLGSVAGRRQISHQSRLSHQSSRRKIHLLKMRDDQFYHG